MIFGIILQLLSCIKLCKLPYKDYLRCLFSKIYIFMKKLLLATLAVLTFVSCYDDSKILGELSNLGDQLALMEERLKTAEKDLSDLQMNVNALAELADVYRDGGYIKSLVQLSDGSGYTITLSNDKVIVIGSNEKDSAPEYIVGVLTIDGKLVWAINGVPLKNGDEYIYVDAAAPKFQINDKEKKLEVSYDNGKTWSEVGDLSIKVTGDFIASTIFSDVKIDEQTGEASFTLVGDGSVIRIPLSVLFEIMIETEVKVVGENTVSIPYYVKGATDKTVVTAFAGGMCDVEVKKDSIIVSRLSSRREILVCADNQNGMSSIKLVTIMREPYRIEVQESVKYMPTEGGQFTLSGVANTEFDVVIQSDASWLTLVETKSEPFTLTFNVEENKSGYRSTDILFMKKNSDMLLMVVTVCQESEYGNGTENVPYIIASAADMKMIGDRLIPGQTVYFKMIEDIDMLEITEWIQINSYSPYNLCISFDGNGHKISNYKGTTGLFRVLNGTFQNVVFENCEVAGDKNIGLLADYIGYTKDPNTYTGHVKNVTFKDCKFTGANDSGLLSGYTYDATVEEVYMENCVMTVTGRRQGFLTGRIEGNSVFRNCYVKGGKTSGGTQQCGGLIGQNNLQTAVITNCGISAVIEGNRNMGGIMAFAKGPEGSTYIENCLVWTPSIVCAQNTGSLYSSGVVVGCSNHNSVTYKNNYRRADIVFADYCPEIGTLVDCPDIEGLKYPLMSLVSGQFDYAFGYHGKAAPAGKTPSQMAKELGWDETIWDLSAEEPSLKNN